MRNKKLVALCECSVLLALSVALSFVEILPMPMGGSVTLLSMLPVMLAACKYGTKTGLSVSLLFSLFHLAKGFFSGNVFVWCTGIAVIAVCVAFDYVLPFTVLGAAGIFRKKGTKGILAGMVLVMFIRFLCHFVTGVAVWGQWAPEGQSKFVYSLIYNGQYMLPECIFTTVAAAVLLRVKQVRKLLVNG